MITKLQLTTCDALYLRHKYKAFLIIVLSLIFYPNRSSLYAQSSSFQWAIHPEGAEVEIFETFEGDSLGNLFVAGYFQDTVDFDPGPGIHNLISSGNIDIFAAKYDQNGQLVWAQQMGGLQSDAAASITLDNLGNVIVAGAFRGTADFDPGPGTFNMTAQGSSNIFIVKLSPTGQLVWATQLTGTPQSVGNVLAIKSDSLGNIYSTGFFTDTVDFNPGPGVRDIIARGTTRDAYVLKLDDQGNFVWANHLATTDAIFTYSLAVDDTGNVYTTGTFRDSIIIHASTGGDRFGSTGTLDMYIIKMNTNGGLSWANRFGGNQVEACRSLAVGDSGNIYITGHFFGDIDFDFGSGTNLLSSTGTSSVFVGKYSNSADLIWVRKFSGTVSTFSNDIILDHSSNIYFTGNFRGTINFDPNQSNFSLTASPGLFNVFTAKLGNNGDFEWATGFAESSSARGLGLAADKSGGLYTFGIFSGTVDFNPGSGIFNLTSAWWREMFIQKMNSCIPFVNPNATNITACDSLTSPSGKYRWTTTGTFMDTIPNVFGCDSIISVNLTIMRSDSSDLVITTCDSYISPSGNYTWTNSGTYMDTIPTSSGCDSVISVHLTITRSDSSDLVTTSCDSYVSPSGNYTWTNSGTYMDTIPTSSGCDSVIRIQLTINTVNNSVSQNAGVLTANAAQASYQWLDCDNGYSPITGDTLQSFMPVANGNYAVQVTQNGCIDTSGCIAVTDIGIQESSFAHDITVFPNPSDGLLVIDLGAVYGPIEVAVRNGLGQIMERHKLTQRSRISLELKGSDGYYFIEISAGNENTATIKVLLKQK